MTWWLSFVDEAKPEGERFLGVVLVDAWTFREAIDLSHQHKVNPGGQVAGWSVEVREGELDPVEYVSATSALAAAPRLTLLSKSELARLDLIDADDDKD
jgi:hypothetical protein